jgi:hypothetical protein
MHFASAYAGRMTNYEPEARRRLADWGIDPLRFVREAFDVEPDPWQAEVLGAFRNKQRIALKACNGPGKTALMAWLAWKFLATRPYPKVAPNFAPPVHPHSGGRGQPFCVMDYDPLDPDWRAKARARQSRTWSARCGR